MLDWALMIAGAALVLAALADVYATIFHYDSDGPLGHPMRRFLWRGLVRVSRSRRRLRRLALGYAGPALVAATFLLWFGTFIVGFALMVVPHLETAYRSESELAPAGFLDALYYSGITASVLGYGDITPISAPLEVLAFVESGLGFLLFTATITYAITLLTGASQRNALTNRVRRMSGGRWQGTSVVTRLLPAGVEKLATRIDDISSELATVEEKLHQFPILDLHYRSKSPDHDPEPLLACLAEAVLALHLLSAVEPLLRRPAEELEATLGDVMGLILGAHMSASERASFRQADPEERDRRRLEEIRRELLESGSVARELAEVAAPDPALRFAARTRIFLDALDRQTGWRVEHGAVP